MEKQGEEGGMKGKEINKNTNIMKRFSSLITALLLTAIFVWAQKVMQVHSEGRVAYEIPTAQVDSVTFVTDEIASYITEGSVWKCVNCDDFVVEYTFYPSKNEMYTKVVPDELPGNWLIPIRRDDVLVGYCIKDNTLYFKWNWGNEECDYNKQKSWLFNFISKNEMTLRYGGAAPADAIGGFRYVRQTK